MQANHNHLQEQDLQEHDDDGSELELPDDALANVLGRLPPSSLAASRCVRKHWRSLIDARRLLRADLLPIHLDAFFFNPSDLEYRPSFFAPPSAKRRVTGRRLDFSDTLREVPYIDIRDHCNGLILLWEMVVNPATRQLANLPAFPAGTSSSSMAGITHPYFYLAYDPFLSPQHYEVVLIPSLFLDHPPNSSDDDGDGNGDVESSSSKEEENLEEQQEIDLSADWPPSPYTTHVFCSRKWMWEERSFIRQGEPAGTIADMVRSVKDCQAVYFRGALYVHCQNDSVMRISLSDDTYQMIKSPPAWTKTFDEYPHLSYLGKSEKGVYSALVDQDDGHRCRVWLLNERFGHRPEWVLKSNTSLVDNIPLYYFANKYDNKPWTFDDYNMEEAPTQDELDEWDFDDGIVVKTTPVKPYSQYSMIFIGFHPYKEIVFFRVSSDRSSRVLSYHLDTLKGSRLGRLASCNGVGKLIPLHSMLDGGYHWLIIIG